MLSRNNNGFTVMEILLVVLILAVISVIAVPVYLSMDEKTRLEAYENKARQIELAAERWANDVNLTNGKVITVSSLIEEGYLNADSYNGEIPVIRSPYDNDDMLCYTIEIVMEGGSQVAKLNEKELANCDLKSEEDNAREVLVRAFKIKGDYVGEEILSSANVFDWTNTDILLIVESRSGMKFSKVFWSESGNTITTTLANPKMPFKSDNVVAMKTKVDGVIEYGNANVVSANVFLNTNYEIGIFTVEGTKNTAVTLRIDKEPPLVEAKTGTEWITTPLRDAFLKGTDYVGSGFLGFKIDDEDKIYETTTGEYKVQLGVSLDGSPRTYKIRGLDRAGNFSEPVDLVIKNIDSTGASLDEDGNERISLTPNTTGFTNSVDLTGKAIDTLSGLVAYQFTTTSTVPSDGWIEIPLTNEEIEYKKENITSNGMWYFWVLDDVGNISVASYNIRLIDVEGAESISLTPDTTKYAQSFTLTGKAIDTLSGLVAYQFTTSSKTPSNGWISIEKTNEEIEYKKENITSNGTWYFWVKDDVGNISMASYTISKIDRVGADSISLTPHTTKYAQSFTLTGKAQDTLSGIVAYQFTTSSTTPSNGWIPITRTTKQITQTKSGITANGTWYFWVKDEAGNISMASCVISKIDREGPKNVSLTPSTTAYTNNLTLIGKAIDTLSGIVAYQFTTSSRTPSGGWLTIPRTTSQITQRKSGVTSNGTWYFWVMDEAGNISFAKYEVKQIDSIAGDSMSLTSSTSDYTESLTLTGKATDNLSKIVQYQITNSSSRPSGGWTSVSPTTSITTTKRVTANGTYYLWVKDGVGNYGSKSLRVSNIARIETSTETFESRDSRTISDSLRARGIVELISVSVDNGTVRSSRMSNGAVSFTVSGGTTRTARETVTCREESERRRAEEYEYCEEYYCPLGGRLRNRKCEVELIDGEGTEYYECINGRWTFQDSTNNVTCPRGYTKNYECGSFSRSCSPNGAEKTNPCYGWCVLDALGPFEDSYDAECESYDVEYECDRGEVLEGSYCYYCPQRNSDLNERTMMCSYDCDQEYSYWRYRVTVTYYAQ